ISATTGLVAGGGTPAECLNMGVTAAQYGNVPRNPANQYNGLFSGNVNLNPEKADTYTAGVVLQPRFIPGLALTADYFNIKVKGLVGTLGFQPILNFCAVSGDPSVCSLITRDAAGSLWLDPTA